MEVIGGFIHGLECLVKADGQRALVYQRCLAAGCRLRRSAAGTMMQTCFNAGLRVESAAHEHRTAKLPCHWRAAAGAAGPGAVLEIGRAHVCTPVTWPSR